MDKAATAILLYSSIALMAGGAYGIIGGAGVCVAIGFVIFVNLMREKLEMAIRARQP
jgi:hypothetical protein